MRMLLFTRVCVCVCVCVLHACIQRRECVTGADGLFTSIINKLCTLCLYDKLLLVFSPEIKLTHDWARSALESMRHLQVVVHR